MWGLCGIYSFPSVWLNLKSIKRNAFGWVWMVLLRQINWDLEDLPQTCQYISWEGKRNFFYLLAFNLDCLCIYSAAATAAITLLFTSATTQPPQTSMQAEDQWLPKIPPSLEQIGTAETSTFYGLNSCSNLPLFIVEIVIDFPSAYSIS